MFEYCPKCKAKIEGNQKFCPECGNPLSKTKEKIKSPSKKVLIISGIAIVVIIIVFASLYVYSSGMIQSNTSSTIPRYQGSEESFKSLCVEFNFITTRNIGTRVTCHGQITEIFLDDSKCIYRLLGDNNSFNIFVVNKENYANFAVGEQIQIWGQVMGDRELGSDWGGRTLPLVNAFIIERYNGAPQVWRPRVSIYHGFYSKGETETDFCTEPYYINTPKARIDWNYIGGNDCQVSLKVSRVDSFPSNDTGTINKNSSSGVFYLNNGPGYYYFKLSYYDLNEYQIVINEWESEL